MSDQASFSAALLDTSQPCPPGLCSANGADPASRFAVYRNNVQSSLINALADSYPVVVQLVGDEFFRAMAAVYLQHFPPTSPVLSQYGEDFGSFIQGFSPAAELPYLADVARLERLRVRAYHAADALPLSPEQIAVHLADPQALNDLRVHLHPSLTTLNSAYAVISLWEGHQDNGDLEQVNPAQAECALVLRHHWQVELFRIDLGTLMFVHSLQNDCPLGLALAYAHDANPDFDPSQALALLIRYGTIIHLQNQEATCP